MVLDQVLGDPARLASVAVLLPAAKASQHAMDRLAELAAVVMDTPIGIVNLIDTQQHLVGLVGLGEPFATSRQTPIGTGFCSAILVTGEPLYITDAGAELAGHPTLVELGFAAYAGCPLRDADGRLIGTLCVIDTRPRRWPRADRRALEALASSVVNELVSQVEVTDRVRTGRELERHARRQELLVRASAALNHSLDPAAELHELARAVVPELADLSTVHLLARPVPPGSQPPLPVITDRVAVAGAPGVTLPPKLTGLRWDGDDDPITAAIRCGELVRQPIPATEPPPWARTTGSVDTFRNGLRHVLVAPVIVDGAVIAVVSFLLGPDRPVWNDDDLNALRQIARYAGIALGHGMSYQATRESALVLQRSLLTDPPTVPGLEIYACYRPAGRDEVGGDWYDAFLRRPDQLAVVIGDVVGHDIAAAAAMGQLSATLRSLAMDRCDGPAAIVDRLATINTRLRITPFATLLYGTLTATGDHRWAMCWASAGHPPPLLLTAQGTQLLERVPGPALVTTEFPPRAQAQVMLPPGSTVLFYTDGLIEHRGRDLTANLKDFLTHATATARRLSEPGSIRSSGSIKFPGSIKLLSECLLADAPADDDIAMLAIRCADGCLGG